ncbi:hypothetical protein ACVWW2_001110 [Bradyrhizobium sp. LM4.3]
MTLATRLAIAMILLVAVAVSAAGWLSHYSLEQAFLPRVLDRIETQSRLLASQLEVQTDGRTRRYCHVPLPCRGTRHDRRAFQQRYRSN